MDEANLKQRYETLKKDIHYHNYRYHVLDDPVISDYEYDQLLIELRQIEEQHPEWIVPDSPTQRAGAAPADGFVKVQHPAPILSLGNAYDADSLRAWLERIAKVDERALNAWRPQDTRRSRRQVTTDEEGVEPEAVQVTATSALERFCLAVLLGDPELLYRIDRSFQELNLSWLFALLGISLAMVLIAWWLFLRRDIRLAGEGSWQLPKLLNKFKPTTSKT